MTDLGAAAFNRSNTYRINERGEVIGWIFTESQQERAVLWRGDRRIDLGTFGGTPALRWRSTTPVRS